MSNKKACFPTSINLGVCTLDNFNNDNISCSHLVRSYSEPENIDNEYKKGEFAGWLSLCNNCGNCSYKVKLPVYSTGSFTLETYN